MLRKLLDFFQVMPTMYSEKNITPYHRWHILFLSLAATSTSPCLSQQFEEKKHQKIYMFQNNEQIPG